jgi:undecaprenyl-diphosphatase
MPVCSPTSTEGHARRPLPLPRLRAAAGAALIAPCVLAFAALAADLRWSGPVTRADAAIVGWFQAHAQPALTTFLVAVSALHSTLAICLLALCAAAWLAWRRQGDWLPLLAACVPGGLLLNWLVKQAFQRARPALEAPALGLAGYSFPSGHAAGATVWWGFALMMWFAWRPGRAGRAAACAVAGAMVLLAALSRVYLGVHYLSDVLAAMAEGVGWLVLCVVARQALAPRAHPGRAL